MKKRLLIALLSIVTISVTAQLNNETAAPRATTVNGIVEGTYSSGIRMFKGVPYAKPPVGNLRWKEPQPATNWTGIRKADKFGPRAVQLPLFSDMIFRSNGMSEDCLYLNIWTPAKTATERLPVLVYFFGGGFKAGDGSESRYEGESMARKGIVAITVNFRLTVFGFLAHPELTKESPHHTSGNYGLMDQAAALKWVQQNIAAFGGDPKKVTIAGESAGSFSVSAQMASPLSKNLIAGAIGESGSLLGLTPTMSLAEAEKIGVQFVDSVSAKSLADLRAMSAEQIIQATSKRGNSNFPVTVDGYFFPKSPLQIFTEGGQAHVPLLVGWNSEENNYRSIIGQDKATMENYTNAIQKLYGNGATDILKAYHAASDDDVQQAATDLASDRFIAYGTWKWSDVQSKTGGQPVYRYLYARSRPLTIAQAANLMIGEADKTMSKDTLANAIKKQAAGGAVHSAEIEYAMGNLPANRVYYWQPDDYKISEILQGYFANFIKTGNPNGTGLPTWPAVQSNTVPVMHIDVNTRVEPEKNRQRYLLLETLQKNK